MEKLKELFKSRNFWLIVLIVIFIIVFIIYARKRKAEKEQVNFAKKVKDEAVKDKVTEKEKELNLYLRKLWGEHASWTDNYIKSYLSGSKDVNDVTRRLLKNQEQIGRSLGMWYGDKNGLKIGDLLKNQLISFGDMLSAMVGKDKQKAIMSEKRWHDNTDKLVDFLVSINPKWNRTEMSQHFKKYNESITGIAGNRIKRRHQEEIKSFDSANNIAMYDIADFMTNGIVKQHPEHFDKDPEPVESNEESNKE